MSVFKTYPMPNSAILRLNSEREFIKVDPWYQRRSDVWTLEKVGTLVGEMHTANPELAAYAFLNRADARGQDNEDAAGALQETAELRFLEILLGARKAFSNAAAQGMAVTELKPPDPKATDEIMILYRYLFDTNLISDLPAGA